MNFFSISELIVLIRRKWLVLLVFMSVCGGVAYGSSIYIIRSNYEIKTVFQPETSHLAEVNQERLLLLESTEISQKIIERTPKELGLTDFLFRSRTLLLVNEDGTVSLIQTMKSKKMAQVVMEETKKLLSEQTNWQLLSTSPIFERTVAYKRVTAIGLLLGFFVGFSFIFGEVIYKRRFASEEMQHLKEEGKVFMRNKKPTFFMMKRVLDILLGSLGLIPFLLLYSVLYIPYSFGENKGPLLFKQKRYGLNGEYFHIYKFRSMKVDAEKILKSNPELWQKYVENGYKLVPEEDPRITRLGRFIRKTSLDEFPQFINVVKGDMSLVGPRPIITEELDEYGDKKRYFLAMKPGITGVWGVSGRSNLEYPERCDIELSYLEKQGILFDFQVLWKTFTQVLKKDGAY